jgi:hypothetical protein
MPNGMSIVIRMSNILSAMGAKWCVNCDWNVDMGAKWHAYLMNMFNNATYT